MVKTLFKGIQTYCQEDADHFYGRNTEINDICNKIQSQFITIVYGRSGIGKSSLLNAGVIPALSNIEGISTYYIAQADKQGSKCVECSITYIPIRIVLNCQDDTNYEQQIIDKTVETLENIDKKKVELSSRSFQSLLTQFNFSTSIDNKLQFRVPVFIIDQFEETYLSLGNKQKRIDFLNTIQQIYQCFNGLTTSENIQMAKFVISIREDFLGFMEDDSELFPILKYNRYRVRALTVRKAKNIIKHLTNVDSQDTLNLIIKNIMGLETDSDFSEDDILDSMILSLYCQEIDMIRIKENKDIITYDNVFKHTAESVLIDYIDDCLSKISKQSQEYVEECMVSSDGYKLKISEEEFYENLAQDEISSLLKKGVIVYNKNGYEIAHDRLCPPISQLRSRHLRKRENWTNYFLFLPFFVFIAFSTYFLASAAMNDVYSTLFGSKFDCAEQSRLVSSVHVVLNCALVGVLMLFPHLFKAYLNRAKYLEFYSLIILVISFLLCFYHWKIYCNQHHIVFGQINEDIQLYWYIIYIGVIAVPLFTFIPSLFYRNRNKKYHILRFWQIFNIKAIRVFTLGWLLVFLWVAIEAPYHNAMSCGEAFLIIIPTMYCFNAIFDTKHTFIQYLFAFVGIFVLLFLFDDEFKINTLENKRIFNMTKSYSDLTANIICIIALTCSFYSILRKFNIYVRFVLSLILSLVILIICKQNYCIWLCSMLLLFVIFQIILTKEIETTKYKEAGICCVNILFFTLISIWYLGFNPLNVNRVYVSDEIRWFDANKKQRYCISSSDGKYGIIDTWTLKPNKTILPCIFDTVATKSQQKIPLLGIALNKDVSSSLCDNRDGWFCLEKKLSGDTLYINPMFNHLANEISEKGNDTIQCLSGEAYNQLTMAFVRHLKYNKKIDLFSINKLYDLYKFETQQLDLLYKKYNKSNDVLNHCDITDLIKALNRQLVTACLLDVIENNDTPEYSTLLLENFFISHLGDFCDHNKIYLQGKISANLDHSYEISDTIISGSKAVQFSTSNLANNDVYAYMSLWDMSAFLVENVFIGDFVEVLSSRLLSSKEIENKGENQIRKMKSFLKELNSFNDSLVDFKNDIKGIYNENKINVSNILKFYDAIKLQESAIKHTDKLLKENASIIHSVKEMTAVRYSKRKHTKSFCNQNIAKTTEILSCNENYRGILQRQIRDLCLIQAIIDDDYVVTKGLSENLKTLKDYDKQTSGYLYYMLDNYIESMKTLNDKADEQKQFLNYCNSVLGNLRSGLNKLTRDDRKAKKKSSIK